VGAEDDVPANTGRNEPCPCGSGKKYKQCHLAADEAKERDARAKATAAAPAPAAEAAAEGATPASGARPKHVTRQPWKKTATNTQGFGKTSLPRKVGGG
jgi:hypothetical protein